MENNQVMMMKEKLEFFGIIKESLKLISRNPKLVILTFLTSFPYFLFMLFFEVNFLESLVHTIKSELESFTDDSGFGLPARVHFYWPPRIIDIIIELIHNVLPPFVFPGLLHLGIAHLLQLFTIINTVYSAFVIYAGEDTVNLKEMLCGPYKKVGLKGPLVTSVYVLALTSLTWTGIVSFWAHFLLLSDIFKAVFVLIIIALLMKYIDWGAIWNMGMVLSILEEKHGYVALGVSAYISRGSRKRGFLLMTVFFVWWVALRLMSVYGMWSKSRNMNWAMASIVEVFLVCLGNVVNWVAFTVYFFDCKKRFLEKKVDVEQGKATDGVKL